MANAIIADGLRRDPERVYQVLATLARLLAENYSAAEVSAAIDKLLGELEAHDQARH